MALAQQRAQMLVETGLKEAARLQSEMAHGQTGLIVRAAELVSAAINTGKKVIWFGNGGSATQAQHMAAEFVGRFQKERRALPAISLTENMASVTAIANDYAYEQIFSRQLQGLAQVGDIVIGLSTSGNSPNVLEALRAARTMKLTTIGLTGSSGGQMGGLCDLCIRVPSTSTARIQELHLTIGHLLCALIEDSLLSP